jgi:hypothetical protein
MVRHHHRFAPAIAVTLALAAAPASASAMFELNSPVGTQTHSSSPAGTNLCSEVCSGGGYLAVQPASVTPARTGAALPHDPRPRSEAVSGAGYANPSVPSTAVRVVAPSGGFHWGDAGIGAGGAVVLTMLVLGGVLGATSIRRRASGGPAQPTT